MKKEYFVCCVRVHGYRSMKMLKKGVKLDQIISMTLQSRKLELLMLSDKMQHIQLVAILFDLE